MAIRHPQSKGLGTTIESCKTYLVGTCDALLQPELSIEELDNYVLDHCRDSELGVADLITPTELGVADLVPLVRTYYHYNATKYRLVVY
jgi:hypothetical protein